jgi:hypothetical protein
VTGFVLRAPWYVRERAHFGLRDPRALRPSIQMYDGTDFVTRLLADPRDSLALGDDDWWSYPVPVTPSATAHGRARLATWGLIKTPLRKLYQPSHSRFYAVVVEVFCDEAGLPRAGSHRDIEVRFVMRRWRTSVTGAPRPTRRLARNLLIQLAAQQHVKFTGAALPEDVRDLWWAEHVAFEEKNRDLIDQMVVDSAHEGWFTNPSALAGWKRFNEASTGDVEQEFPMWRLPRRLDDCDAAATRSTWFGIIPTHSGEHFVRGNQVHTKLDDRAIYQVRCFVRQKPAPGHEQCPPKVFWGGASESFRLASPMDSQGTSKRITTITQPDLRQLGARAGRRQGPGGVRIATPPQSQLVINPFKGIPPDAGSGSIGAGGGTCTFALELLFIVAFFLFQLFLPIVIFVFQLWWMLALRFCFPPSGSLGTLASFFAQGHLLAQLETDATLNPEFDQQFGLDSPSLPPAYRNPGWAKQLDQATDQSGQKIFTNDPNFVHALVEGTDPTKAVQPAQPGLKSKPSDPLCP